MIDERINMLDLINLRLAELIDNIDIHENMSKFKRLCNANRIDFMNWYMVPISTIYAVNVALECLRDGISRYV